MKIVIDIDGTICNQSKDYNNAKPYTKRIEYINQLYDNGNTIVFFTARGYETGIDWYDITKSQLKQWGVKFDELILGKPSADIYIDDRNVDDTFLDKNERDDMI